MSKNFEEEHRQRVLRYQHARIVMLREIRRNQYRLKHNIPLNAPITRGRPVEYDKHGKLLIQTNE